MVTIRGEIVSILRLIEVLVIMNRKSYNLILHIKEIPSVQATKSQLPVALNRKASKYVIFARMEYVRIKAQNMSIQTPA